MVELLQQNLLIYTRKVGDNDKSLQATDEID